MNSKKDISKKPQKGEEVLANNYEDDDDNNWTDDDDVVVEKINTNEKTDSSNNNSNNNNNNNNNHKNDNNNNNDDDSKDDEFLAEFSNAMLGESLISNVCSCCCTRNFKFLCSKCRNVKYCSTDCQKRDWSTHKQHCGIIKEESESVPTKYSIAYTEYCSNFIKLLTEVTIDMKQKQTKLTFGVHDFINGGFLKPSNSFQYMAINEGARGIIYYSMSTRVEERLTTVELAKKIVNLAKKIRTSRKMISVMVRRIINKKNPQNNYRHAHHSHDNEHFYMSSYFCELKESHVIIYKNTPEHCSMSLNMNCLTQEIMDPPDDETYI